MYPKSYKKRMQKQSPESIKMDYIEHCRNKLICNSISGSLSSKLIVAAENDCNGEDDRKYKNGYFNKYILPPLKIKCDTIDIKRNDPCEKNIIRSYYTSKKRKLSNPNLVSKRQTSTKNHFHTSLFCEQLQKYGTVDYFRESNDIRNLYIPLRREVVDEYQPPSHLHILATLLNEEPETPNILNHSSSFEQNNQISEAKRDPEQKISSNQKQRELDSWVRKRENELKLQRAVRIVSFG